MARPAINAARFVPSQKLRRRASCVERAAPSLREQTTEHELTGMARVGDDMMRAGPLMHIPALIRTMGYNPLPLLRSAGFAPDALAHPEEAVPLQKVVRFLVGSASRTGRPHFGLLVGQSTSLEQFGLIGQRMKHARSVGLAWRGVILTLQLNGRASVPALSVRDRIATLSFTPYRAESEGAWQVMDFTLATACTAMRRICGPEWAPDEVHLAHRSPIDVRPYHRCFKAPVHFGMGRTAILFPATLLNRRVLGADRLIGKAIDQTIADMLRRQLLGLPDKVRRALFAQMTQDDVSIEGVARLLGMHKRTLNRRLAEEDTNFARLLAEVRFQIARRLLQDTDLPLVDIAATLNYTDASAFSRAFRSWAREAPANWRKAHVATAK